MKFVKVMAGWYKSENGKYEINNFQGFWTVYKAIPGQFKKICIGCPTTLKKAKELCEED